MINFVTGGSGFVGGHLIRRLLGDGHDVRALARSDEARERVESLGATSVWGDLAAQDALRTGMAGADTVYHCAAWVGTWGDRNEIWEANVEGTRNVIDAAQTSGVRRLVHMSSVSAIDDEGHPDLIDETTSYPDQFLSIYSESKSIGEQMVLEANGNGLETVAIRPPIIWGPEDGAWLPGLIEKVEMGVFRWVDGGDDQASTAHVYNVVEISVLASQRGDGGNAYFVTDDEEISFREFVSAYIGTAGVVAKESSVPGWLMQAAGSSLEGIWKVLGLKSPPPLNRAEVAMIRGRHAYSVAKARTELGYEPVITIEKGMAELGQ